jgi:HK97 gp10 family phage protein
VAVVGAVKFELTGDKELDAKLSKLPLTVQKKCLRPGLREGAKVILDEAKANAPKKTGALAKGLKVRAAKRSRKNRWLVTMRVITAAGFFKGSDFYSSFQEFGYRLGPRKLGNKRKQIPGKHFIEGAAKSKGDAAKGAALKRIAEDIEKEAAK